MEAGGRALDRPGNFANYWRCNIVSKNAAISLVMKETENIIGATLDLLPLTTSAHITEGNALRLDWSGIVPREKLSYIIGNPPFVGARLMTKEQKSDLFDVFAGWKNAGELDYVTSWFKKSFEFIKDTGAKAALVSTNSITQGEQVPILWPPLAKAGLRINFAHRTFRWDSEAKIKAHVHCVIIGFGDISMGGKASCFIFDGKRVIEVKHINAYLMDGDDIYAESFKSPITPDAPLARSGNKPIDNGEYLFTEAEYKEFIAKEPQALPYFRRWYGSEEYINNKTRYCLWLGDLKPGELRKMPECLKRVDAVRQYRLASKSQGTVKLADRPTRFHVETLPKDEFIIMPLTSSERRRYVPIGFIKQPAMASNLVTVVMSRDLYHFGVLTSSCFMTWMRAVGGRLKSDYRITKDNVYNNFPWPEPHGLQREKIAQAAEAILNIRDKFPESSLADLYDDSVMPYELRQAHSRNDKLVLAAYGLAEDAPEDEILAFLLRRYRALTAPGAVKRKAPAPELLAADSRLNIARTKPLGIALKSPGAIPLAIPSLLQQKAPNVLQALQWNNRLIEAY